MKPTCQRVRDALLTGPKTTHDLMQADVGGRNFPARVHELRGLGYTITERRVRQGSSVYTLTPATRDQRPDNPPAPTLTAVPTPTHQPPHPYPDGQHVLCTHCSYRFTEPGATQDCPRCQAGCHWLEQYHHQADRDRAARLVDPEKVARELAYHARARADRERAATRTAA